MVTLIDAAQVVALRPLGKLKRRLHCRVREPVVGRDGHKTATPNFRPFPPPLIIPVASAMH